MAAETVVLATRNAAKLRELPGSWRRGPRRADRLVGLDEFPGAPDVPETGPTFEENALLKARAIARLHRPARGRRRLRALRGRAQRHARRAVAPAGRAGTATTRPTWNWCWPRSADVPDAQRGAAFVCAAALVAARRARSTVRRVAGHGRVGCIARRAASGGFGYDPIFVPDGLRPDHRRDDRGGEGRDQPPRPGLPRADPVHYRGVPRGLALSSGPFGR